jgi:hypothetical protein
MNIQLAAFNAGGSVQSTDKSCSHRREPYEFSLGSNRGGTTTDTDIR